MQRFKLIRELHVDRDGRVRTVIAVVPRPANPWKWHHWVVLASVIAAGIWMLANIT